MGTKDEILNGGNDTGAAAVRRRTRPAGDNTSPSPVREQAATGSTGSTGGTVGTGLSGDAAQEARLRGMGTDVRIPEAKPETNVERFRRLNPQGLPSAAEEARERKREKRERLFASIGDGISALSNLFFTTRYAPSMYDPRNSQYAAVDDRWTRLRKERDENRRRYVDGYLKAIEADDLQKIRQQNADTNANYKKAETERKAAIAKAQNEALGARQRKDDAAADLADKKLEYLIAGWPAQQAEQQAKIDLLKARKKQADAGANNANASADEHRRRGTSSLVGSSSSSSSKRGVSSSGGEYVAYDEDGNEHRFKQKGAAEQYAREHGTWQTDYATSETNKYGIKSTRRAPNGGHSVKPKKSNPANGGGSSGGSNGKKTINGFGGH